jgi:hypothetical protein
VVDPQVILSHRFEPSILGVWRRGFAYGDGAAERWKKQPGWPSLPIVGPAAIIVTAVVALLSWPVALLLGLGTLSAPCAVWVSRGRIRRRLAVVAYPFVSLVDDLAKISGFVQGARNKRG